MKYSVAIMPLRAGSKGIPGKNKRKLLGKPLYQWLLAEAAFSELDVVYVFTDDLDIEEQVLAEYRWSPKIQVMRRSEESASDVASTEIAMLEFVNHLKEPFDFICLLQATSPLTTRSDINACLNAVEEGGFDSALTVVENKRFF